MPIFTLPDRTPQLPEPGTFWVAPDAQVIGSVRLARDVSVWFGAVLRGDNELIDVGEGTNIQDGAMLHTDPGIFLTLGQDVTVGHHAILHGCTIGDGCLIGMGATVLNRASIGAGSLVGANALVAEGKSFPERSLIVGAPARAIRTLDDAAVEMMRTAAVRYKENWRRYAARLMRVG